MTDKSVEQFQKLLKPIQESLVDINKRLDGHDRNFDEINEKLGFYKDNLEEINKKQDQHTKSLVNIENKIGAYGDMYQINDDNVRKLEKRIDVLEEKNGIELPPEVRLANF